MKITWLIPDTFGFLLDELEVLSEKNVSIRVLSGEPIKESVKKRLPNIEFYYCPPKSIILASLFSKRYNPLWKLHGWRLIRNGYHTKKIAGYYKVLSALEKYQKSDVIHCHFAHPGGVGGGLINKPQVLTLRGYDILTAANYGSLWNNFFRTNLMLFAKQKTIITGGSEYTVTKARQILDFRADIRLIKEGLSGFTFKNANMHNRSTLKIADHATVILSAGNLVSLKNHELLLHVFASVVKIQKKQLHLIICGDGPMEKYLKNLCQSMDISHQVTFMGRLNREELTDIFQLADIYAHTSMSEGFGNVIVEAMLFELLVVASPVGVAADIIEHNKNGFLPKLGDKKSWIECLNEAIENRAQFTDQLQANKAMVKKDFTMEARIDAYLNLYNEAIESFKNGEVK